MARNLIADGYQVAVYDRSKARMELLKSAGAKVASGLGGLAICPVILTSLPDDSALAQVALGEGGLVHVLTPGAIHISMSTISPDLSRRLSEQHQLAEQGWVAGPVLGNPDLAHARKLFVIAAGHDASYFGDVAFGPGPLCRRHEGDPRMLRPPSPRLRRSWNDLDKRLFLIGEDPDAANLMKLAGRVLTALTLESIGEVQPQATPAQLVADAGEFQRSRLRSRSGPLAETRPGWLEHYRPSGKWLWSFCCD